MRWAARSLQVKPAWKECLYWHTDVWKLLWWVVMIIHSVMSWVYHDCHCFDLGAWMSLGRAGLGQLWQGSPAALGSQRSSRKEEGWRRKRIRGECFPLETPRFRDPNLSSPWCSHSREITPARFPLLSLLLASSLILPTEVRCTFKIIKFPAAYIANWETQFNSSYFIRCQAFLFYSMTEPITPSEYLSMARYFSHLDCSPARPHIILHQWFLPLAAQLNHLKSWF